MSTQKLVIRPRVFDVLGSNAMATLETMARDRRSCRSLLATPGTIRSSDDLLDLVVHLASRTRPLTLVELRIAKLRLLGLTREDIAVSLGRSINTVDHHLKAIRRKLACNSASGLFKAAADALDADTPPATGAGAIDARDVGETRDL